jgi:hypothetical protein
MNGSTSEKYTTTVLFSFDRAVELAQDNAPQGLEAVVDELAEKAEDNYYKEFGTKEEIHVVDFGYKVTGVNDEGLLEIEVTGEIEEIS